MTTERMNAPAYPPCAHLEITETREPDPDGSRYLSCVVCGVSWRTDPDPGPEVEPLSEVAGTAGEETI